MYIYLAILAAFTYAIQGILVAPFYRRMDPLLAVAIRGCSFLITMLPYAFFIDFSTASAIPSLWPHIIAMACITVVANMAYVQAVRFLTLGVGMAIMTCTTTIGSMLLGGLVLGDTVTMVHVVFLSLLAFGIAGLSLLKSTAGLPPEYDLKKGVSWALATGVLMTFAFFTMGHVSRQVDALLAGYMWEAFTGVAAIIAFAIRQGVSKNKVKLLSIKDTIKFSLCCSPTVIASGAYAMAMSGGHSVVATALLSLNMVFTSVMAWIVFKEKLKPLQWLLILLVCALIIVMKVML